MPNIAQTLTSDATKVRTSEDSNILLIFESIFKPRRFVIFFEASQDADKINRIYLLSHLELDSRS